MSFQLGYRSGTCVKGTTGRAALPVAPATALSGACVAKRLASGTLAVPASVETSVPLMAAPVRSESTLSRARSLSSTCGPTCASVCSAPPVSCAYSALDERSSASGSGRSIVLLASVRRKLSCVSACVMEKRVGPRAAAAPSVPPLVRKACARSDSDLLADTRSAYVARRSGAAASPPVGVAMVGGCAGARDARLPLLLTGPRAAHILAPAAHGVRAYHTPSPPPPLLRVDHCSVPSLGK